MNARTNPSNPRSRHQSRPEPVLVLDLGTSRVRAALLIDGRPRVIDWPELPASDGVPVVIGLDPQSQQLVVGDEARRLMLTEPNSMLEAGPRLLGVRAELAGFESGGRFLNLHVARGRGGDVDVLFDEERWPVPRAVAVLLQSLTHRIEQRFGVTIERTFVSIPPGADDARRRALTQTLQIAGLPEVALVPTTTAAALALWTLEREGPAALGLVSIEAQLAKELDLPAVIDPDPGSDSDSESDPALASDPASASDPAPDPAALESTALIFDLGAGSFDASIVRFDRSSVEVLASRSRLDVGGLDIDARIGEWLFEQFEAANEIDLSGEPTVRARVRDVAERAKIALTDAERFEVELPYLWADASGPKHLFCTLDRARFERLIHSIVDVPVELARELMADANLGPDDLDTVVMLGGTSRVPVVQDRVEALIGRVPQTELGDPQLDGDFGLRGLALEAHRRARRRPETRVVEVASHGVWLRGPTGTTLVIEAGKPLPTAGSVAVRIDPAIEWSEPFELWQSSDGTGQPALAFQLGGERAEIQVHVELDLAGRIGVRIDERVRGKQAALRLQRRFGLSARAVQRFTAEARERAWQTETRDRHDAVRRGLQESIRAVEGWLADPKAGLDELLAVSLGVWSREAEAALADAGFESMRNAVAAFDVIVETLPAKLQDGLGVRPALLEAPAEPLGVELDAIEDEDDLPLWAPAGPGSESE